MLNSHLYTRRREGERRWGGAPFCRPAAFFLLFFTTLPDVLVEDVEEQNPSQTREDGWKERQREGGRRKHGDAWEEEREEVGGGSAERKTKGH